MLSARTAFEVPTFGIILTPRPVRRNPGGTFPGELFAAYFLNSFGDAQSRVHVSRVNRYVRFRCDCQVMRAKLRRTENIRARSTHLNLLPLVRRGETRICSDFHERCTLSGQPGDSVKLLPIKSPVDVVGQSLPNGNMLTSKARSKKKRSGSFEV